MKAHILGADGPELADIPQPKPGPEDVLVRVRACALNRADLAMARGVVHGGAGGSGAVLGLEYAGEVAAVGAAVVGLAVGDRVMGSSAAAFAEYVSVDMGRVQKIPRGNMSYAEAATLPVALQTMHDAVVTHGELKAGQSVLILGASSGVGLMGLQIAREKGAALVIGTSTDAERRGKLAEFGAQLAVDTNDAKWVKQVRDATGGEGVDVVVDQVTGKLASQTLHATRVLGRIVNVGRLGGNQAEFDFDIHARRRITFVGVTFRTRTKEEVRKIVADMQADLGPALAAGKLALPISHTFPFADLKPALDLMAANRHFGKIVLEL
ncbi:MAG TPA: zinc-binding dehydrogenase [Hyphomonadaceae bacterium]|jgi:NADPH2:quinone reductase|nr:zinc-binding dehydrogenase [Hyphomonadaceae bacterium]